MNSRELVVHAILGSPIERYPCGPLAVHNTAVLSGVSFRDYTTDAQVMADCVVKYYERFRPDAIWISADTWITAEAMGAKVRFTDDNQPICGTGETLIKSFSDVENIPPVNTLTQGRFPLMQKALKIVKKRLGDEVFIVGCFDQSPFSLACALMGMENLMIKMVDKPALVDALLIRCTEYAAEYAVSLARAGADMLSTGDSAAGLIGRRMYCDFALGAEQKVFQSIRNRCDALLSLHICGDVSHIIEDMARAGCDVLEVDFSVDIENVLNKVGSEIAVWGNIDPVNVLSRGTTSIVEKETLKLLNTIKKYDKTRFVISSGCTLVPDTPVENIHAFIETTKNFKI